MIRTFLDAGVLIAASRGRETHSHNSLRLLADYRRRMLTTVFVKLETLPKPTFNPYPQQREFLRQFFADPDIEWVSDLHAVAHIATVTAEQYGLGALDALHVAAAMYSHADELVTTEEHGKPIYRVDGLNVVHIRDFHPED